MASNPPAKKATAPRKRAATEPTVEDLAPTPPAPTSRAAKSFVKDASKLADDVAAFVDDTRKKLDKLIDAHTDATAAHTGATGHEQVAYQLGRVGSTFADIERALTVTSATVSSLVGAAGTVED